MAKRFLNHVCPWGTQNVLEADWMPGSQSDKRFFYFGNQLHVIKFIFSSVLCSSVINFRNATSISFEWPGGRLFYLIKISFLLRSTGIHYLNNGNQLRRDLCHKKYNTPNWKPWKSIMRAEVYDLTSELQTYITSIKMWLKWKPFKCSVYMKLKLETENISRNHRARAKLL